MIFAKAGSLLEALNGKSQEVGCAIIACTCKRFLVESERLVRIRVSPIEVGVNSASFQSLVEAGHQNEYAQ